MVAQFLSAENEIKRFAFVQIIFRRFGEEFHNNLTSTEVGHGPALMCFARTTILKIAPDNVVTIFYAPCFSLFHGSDREVDTFVYRSPRRTGRSTVKEREFAFDVVATCKFNFDSNFSPWI